ncbi:MAG: hypothetical protein DYG89_42510 [Caldilinea sp. CFX5]|nr:hypothetical protein [Caldilinea sp. CFX5]
MSNAKCVLKTFSARTLRAEPRRKSYHLLPSVRDDLLAKRGRYEEARAAPSGELRDYAGT